MLRLALMFERANARPVRVATVGDRGLVSSAARTALQEALLRAAAIDEVDPALGCIELAEAHKLQEILAAFMPELRDATLAPAPVM